MRDWHAIRRAYEDTNDYFDRARQRVADADPDQLYEMIQRSRLNDFAYFVLIWGQFEALIDGEAGEDARGLDFMGRVATLLPPHDPAGFHHVVGDLYERRCKLAHGRLSRLPDLFLSTILDTLERIADAIESGGPAGDSPDLFGFDPS